jgi:hypothetical protein
MVVLLPYFRMMMRWRLSSLHGRFFMTWQKRNTQSEASKRFAFGTASQNGWCRNSDPLTQ